MTTARVRIRAATPADLPAVERIERASFEDPWVRTVLLQELEPSDLRMPLIIETAGEVAGYLMAWRSGDELHVLNVAVDPARRRRGLAAALLEEALAEARRCGMKAVSLEVRPGNRPAVALYRAYGFETIGRRPGYYANTGEDALIMTLRLA